MHVSKEIERPSPWRHEHYQVHGDANSSGGKGIPYLKPALSIPHSDTHLLLISVVIYLNHI